ncbi:MAG: hypothetical protein ACHQ49_08475 [Elusimicrobiota bacterium]
MNIGDNLKLAIIIAGALIYAPLAGNAQNFKANLSDFSAPRVHGKLDLDIDSTESLPLLAPTGAAGLPNYGWAPGDPRDQRAEPAPIKHLSHVGYAALGVAGAAASIATGGVAPAIGFGIIALWQSWQEWRLCRAPS